MAATRGTLVNALLRIAKQQPDPSAYLMGIISGNFTSTINGDGTVTISTSTGGSAVTFTLPQGSDPLAMVELAELAMQNLETGVDAPVVWSAQGTPEQIPTIQQINNSQRRASYAQFGNVQH